MKKKLLALLMASAMMAGTMTGCGGTSTDAVASDSTQGDTTNKTYNIGICQLVQHPALDAATQGFTEKLTELLGDQVTFDLQNASGDSATCSTIIGGFVSANTDLIVANATAPLQAAASGTATIPILGTSISDYGTALDISDWTGTTGRNISGTSDLAPLDQQAAMVKEWFPDAKTIGLLYCSAEPNSYYQISVIQPELEKLGYTVNSYGFADSNDLASIVTKAVGEVNAIYIPTDNTAASNAEIIKNIVVPAKIPVIAGEEGIAKGCGVATLSISYYEIGQVTAEMAYDVLVNGSDIVTMPVKFAPTTTKKYNAEICQALGLTPPEGYTAIEG